MNVLAWPGSSTKGLNPYNALLYSSLQREGVSVTEYRKRHLLSPGTFDILHVHWPDGIFRDISRGAQLYTIALFFREIVLAKLWGMRIIWTVHNLRPHCRRNEALEPLFYRIWLHLVDGMIFLTHHSKISCHEKYPDSLLKPFSVIPHGHYRDLISEQRTPDAAKKLLGLEAGAHYLVFIGQVRSYKNVPHLIECFKSANLENWKLMIAGLPESDALSLQLAQLAENESRIVLNLELLSDEQLEACTQAASLVVLPYKSVLNSGSVIYALSCGRTLLVPASETFCELRDFIKTEGILTYEGELKPEDLRHSVNALRPMPEVNLDPLNWEHIGILHREFFKAVIDGRPNPVSDKREPVT